MNDTGETVIQNIVNHSGHTHLKFIIIINAVQFTWQEEKLLIISLTREKKKSKKRSRYSYKTSLIAPFKGRPLILGNQD